MSRYIAPAVKRYVRERDNNKCVYCGSRHWKIFGWELNKPLEMGHVIPYSKGGNNCIENIQLECFKCNRSKGDEYKKLGFLKRWTHDEAQGCKGRCTHLKR